MLKKLSTTVSEMGLLDTFIKIVHLFLAKITFGKGRIIKYAFFAQPVGIKELLPLHRGKQIEIRQISAAEIHALKEFPREINAIKKRFEQGGICLAAYIKGNFSGYIWFNLHDYREDEVKCIYSPWPEKETAWDYDIYIKPSVRLGFVFAKLWDSANAQMAKQGIRWTLSRISVFNQASLLSHQRIGAEKIGTATFICLGSLQLMLATVSPYICLSIGETNIPKIIFKMRNGSTSLDS